jgi:hypothetical protein
VSPAAAKEILLKRGDPNDAAVQQMLDRIETLATRNRMKNN